MTTPKVYEITREEYETLMSAFLFVRDLVNLIGLAPEPEVFTQSRRILFNVGSRAAQKALDNFKPHD